MRACVDPSRVLVGKDVCKCRTVRTEIVRVKMGRIYSIGLKRNWKRWGGGGCEWCPPATCEN